MGSSNLSRFTIVVGGVLALLVVLGCSVPARADDDTLLSHNSGLVDLSFNDGNGPPPGSDPPPSGNQGGGQGGPEEPVSDPSEGSGPQPCKPFQPTGLTSAFSFIAWFMTPCLRE